MDFKKGRDWYKSRHVAGLSGRFTRAVLDAIARIRENPFAYAVRYRDVRCCHTEVFPYAIHFIINEPDSVVTIIAIIYEGRNPGIGMSRKEEEA